MDIGSGTTDEDSDESESDEEDDLKSAMEPTDFDSLAAEADEEESETTDDEKTEDDEEMESGEGADTEKEGEETDDDTEEERDVDPDVKAADDIATGKKDLEETIETEEDDQLKSKMEPDVPEELTTTDTAEDGGQLTEEATGDTATTQANGDGSNRQADEEQMDTGQTADDEQPDSSDNTPRTTVSALEYNKVMRLLQNREFPVERAEIEEVATSAYDLRESDCAEVIDLAVDRGLIDEQDGQLLRPE